MAYSEQLRDPRWQRKRLEIFERSGWTCEDCESANKTLHVHHTYYESGIKAWEYKNESLLSLCWECHTERHRIETGVRKLEAKLSIYELCLLRDFILEGAIVIGIEEAASKFIDIVNNPQLAK